MLVNIVFIMFWIFLVNCYPREAELHKHLFANYSKRVFPSDTIGDPVKVSLDAEMNYIIELDERNQLLTFDITLNIMWYDAKLSWNISEYDNLTTIHVPVSDVWVPDLSLQNVMAARRRLSKDDQIVKILSNGTVVWVADYVGQMLCPLNMTNYPCDSQNCTLYVESLSHGSNRVQIVKVSAPDISDVYPNGQWELVSTFSELTHEKTGDSVALITLYIKRRRMYHMIATVLPSLVTSCLNPFVFLLPTESGEKVTLSTTLLLFYSVMLTYIFGNIPPTSINMPILGIFVGCQLVLSALSLVCTVIMFHFDNNGKDQMQKVLSSPKANSDDKKNLHEKMKCKIKCKILWKPNTLLFIVFVIAEVTAGATVLLMISN